MDNEVYATLDRLKNNADELGGYLIQLAKEDVNAIKYVDTYSSLLDSNDWYLKKVALYAMLFVFRIKDDAIIEKAEKILIDKKEDDEPRTWAAVGISTVYENTHDKHFIEVFYAILRDANDESNVRLSCLRGLLRIGGRIAEANFSRNLITGDLSSEEVLDITIKEFNNDLNDIITS